MRETRWNTLPLQQLRDLRRIERRAFEDLVAGALEGEALLQRAVGAEADLAVFALGGVAREGCAPGCPVVFARLRLGCSHEAAVPRGTDLLPARPPTR